MQKKAMLVCATCKPCDRHESMRRDTVMGAYCKHCGSGFELCWTHGLDGAPIKRATTAAGAASQ